MRRAKPELSVIVDEWSEWSTVQEFQIEFAQQARGGRIPIAVEVKMMGGEERYRGRFVPRLDGRFEFRTIHGNTEEQYASLKSMADQRGLKQISLSVFENAEGAKRYSGTWVQQPYPVYWTTAEGDDQD